jgi:ketosteroid isomerase-like protein
MRTPRLQDAGTHLVYGLMDTRRMTSEKSTTPDLVELWRQTNEAFVRRDFDAMMSFFAPDAVWDLSSAGIGRFEGMAAIRGFPERLAEERG